MVYNKVMVEPKFHKVKIGFDSACYPPLPNWQHCVMLSTRKPNKYSIRKGHPVEIAYYLPEEDGDQGIFTGLLKEEDIVEFEYVGTLGHKEALEIFRKANDYVSERKKRAENRLERLTGAESKIFGIFPELDPNVRRGSNIT